MPKPTLILADDDTDILQTFEGFLSSEYELVAAVSDGQALVEAAMVHQPDLIITDISMPILSGLRAISQLKAVQPNVRVVFLSVHEDPAFIAEAMKFRNSGYVIKRCAASDLFPAIRAVLLGSSFISPAVHQSRT